MSPNGRSQDIDAIVNVIEKAEKFVHISVMDFFPVSLYTPKPKCVDFQNIFLFKYIPRIELRKNFCCSQEDCQKFSECY